MELKIYFSVFVLLVGNLTAGLSQNTAPTVSNVQAEQRTSSMYVDITFDVDDAEGDLLFVTILVSADTGQTFTVPAFSFIDSVGYGIHPGPGKRIVWNAGADYPESYDDQYRVKVIAIDRPVGKMVYVPTDTFTMGSDSSAEDDAKPAHLVEVSAFYISATEITNVQYKQFCNATDRDYPENPIPGYFDDYPDYPVVNITWLDAIAYCNWLSEVDGYDPCYDLTAITCDTTRNGYRLPTEAEWERTARGGVYGKNFPWGSDTIKVNACNNQAYNEDLVDKMAPFSGSRGPLPVGSFDAMGFGLYDMAGNVSEWCHDWYLSEYYSESAAKDPLGSASGNERIVRGGDWDHVIERARVFHRDRKTPQSTVGGNSRGFRIVRRAK